MANTPSEQLVREFYTTYIILSFLIVPLIVTGNSLVLVAIAKFEQLKTLPNIFVASMASSDLLVGLLTIPVYVGLLYINPELSHSRWPCTWGFVSVVFPVSVSLLSLLAVSADRYIYIMKPLHYSEMMTTRKALIIIMFIWIYSLILSLLPAMGWTKWNNSTKICKLSEVFPFAYSLFMVLQLLVILLAVAILYFKIIREAHRQCRRIFVQTSASTNKTINKDSSGIRLAKMFLLVIGLFYIWWMPYFLLTGARLMITPPEPIQLSIASQTTMFMAFCNSFMNPFVYAAKNTQFRNAFKVLLKIKTGVPFSSTMSQVSNIDT